MCVHVRASIHSITQPWNSDTATITIPAGLSPERTLRAIRAVLAELCIPQPPGTAVCWCGAPVTGLTPRVPDQRTNPEMMAHGA